MEKFKYLLLTLVVLTPLKLYSQLPSWTDSEKRELQFNDKEYIVGFSSEINSNKEAPEVIISRAEVNAKTQINEQILVTVQSNAIHKVSEENKLVKQSFISISSSSTNLTLAGLKKETYYDSKNKIGYALVYAKRSDLALYYTNQVEKGLSEIERIISNYRQENGNKPKNLTTVLNVLKMIQEVEHDQSILVAINKSFDLNSSDYVRLQRVKQTIEEIIRNAQQGKNNTLDDAVQFITFTIKNQLVDFSKPVLISNFTFQDTRLTSELSKRISQSLAKDFVNSGGFKVISENNNTSDMYILYGTYWKEPEDIKLICSLKDFNGKIIASAEAYVPLHYIEKIGISFLPENFEQAYERMRVFNRNEIIKGDLNIEVWTNKGDENLIFNEGEKLKFYIRANKECYIRFIYHMANNESVLLLDNYFIPMNLVNKVVELPDEFECSDPFGSEVLQVNAQTIPFEPLNTKAIDGYTYIDDSLENVIVGTRGIKKTTKNVEKAEKRIAFTTLKK